jgi:hypothetical protein
MLFFFLMTFVFVSPLAVSWFNGGYWWLFIMTPIAFILMVVMVACFMRKREDRATFLRHINVFRALKKAENTYLTETNIQLLPGEYASWIEVLYGAYKPDPQDAELGDFERVRREPEEVMAGNMAPKRRRSPDVSTRNVPDEQFEVSRSSL